MVVIHVQVGRNFIEDVLLDGGYGINIIIEKLQVKLGLPKPKLAPYNLRMANQTIVKPLGLIKDLKNFLHGILYSFTFTVIHSSVLDFNYFVLLGCPWLRDVKVSHDWANTIIIFQGTSIIRIILVTKKLKVPTNSPKKLVCYDFHHSDDILGARMLWKPKEAGILKNFIDQPV
jgi:hypothetical protein